MGVVEGLVEVFARRTRVILAAAFVLTCLAGWSASRLELQADLERLLPEAAPSVQGLARLQEDYGYIGRLTVVLDGPPEALPQAAADVAEALARVPHVERTEHERPVDFFRERRLLYVDYDDLAEATRRIQARLAWEKKRANPLFVALRDEEPPSVDLDDLEEKYGEVDEQRYYQNEDGSRLLVFVFLDFSPSDLALARQAVAAVDDAADAALAAHHPGVSAELTGRYKKRIDQQDSLTDDLSQASVVAVALLVLFLLVYFRGIVAPVLVAIPLVAGTLWAFAWAQLVFGTLNILTGFFGAVLLGLGVDYGIHLLSRFVEARHEGHGPRAAMEHTLASAGRASLFAGMTTMVAFASLTASSFRAFFEYGVIALGGMALLIAANVVVLPCLLFLVAGTRFEPRRLLTVSLAERLARSGDSGSSGPSRRAATAAMTGLVVALGLVAAMGIGRLDFEYDFSKIQATDLRSWHLDGEVDAMLELSQIPAVVLTESREHAERVVAELRERAESLPQGWTVDRVMSVEELLPARQSDKRALIRSLERSFASIPSRAIEGELAEFQAEIRHTLELRRVTVDDLPISLRAPFARRDGGDAGSVVLVFPGIALHDAAEMAEFAEVIRQLPGPRSLGEASTIDAMSDSLLLVDILDFVAHDSLRVLLITLSGLVLTAVLAFRDVRRTALLLGTLGVSVFVAAGLVGLLGIKFNFINMLVLPIWLGLGVDAAFHLMIRREESPDDLAGFLSTSGAVGAAFGTSMIGFGSMLVTEHAGLFSLGALAVVGLGAILLVSTLVQTVAFLRASPGADRSA